MHPIELCQNCESGQRGPNSYSRFHGFCQNSGLAANKPQPTPLRKSRWFELMMGGSVTTDDWSTDRAAERVELPEEAVQALRLDLSVRTEAGHDLDLIA